MGWLEEMEKVGCGRVGIQTGTREHGYDGELVIIDASPISLSFIN